MAVFFLFFVLAFENDAHTADKTPKRVKTFKHTPKTFTRLSASGFLYLFRQDVKSYRIISKVPNSSVLSRDRTKIQEDSRTFILSPNGRQGQGESA
ncbi:hypothetical protein AVEN_154860-1 [Araneus ventricosus]|uniref:Uncharacterized protein n=1 Tax=Araneus ventricosus TaxID=182803 RepID=A0A4Y2Q302_ARAVE|nr:hypothetical protein AVEN_165495-1 [Araneus ventricosus]GBN57784.1 hypothetical protein AVEN_154860-1 [Araneus ventricosus]